MSFAVGKKLGVFELSTLLGVGGMGEVYRARDTKLGREVAIKVLPEEFANDRDRLARFQREARLLAALNHPNIAHIHELQESDGQHYLVMELVEGETLADRISDGPLPLEDIYKFFGQIAEGLEAAHQQGVIHRDLKPANIKITDEGKVSVLDFGLAKATEIQRTVSNDGVTSPWGNNSAGKSSVGQIVGTPAYMSPEQARGKAIDKRTDIWAFGCCLYEALAGQRSFRGETVSDTLAMILAAEPNWKALPESTPSQLRKLVQSCLAKDLKCRLRDIGDAGLELGQIASNPSMDSIAAFLPAGVIGIRRSRFAAVILCGLLIGSLAGATAWNVMRPVALPNQPLKIPQGVVRTTINLPSEGAIAIDPYTETYFVPRFALSADGMRLVYVGGKEGETKLYLRLMNRLEPTLLPGTEGAESPFFSADGKEVGFWSGGYLKKIRVGGSRSERLCPARNLRGAAWTRDHVIYFAESAAGGNTAAVNPGLKRVSESGGEPELFTKNEGDPLVSAHAFPCLLPDGKGLLFTLAHEFGRPAMAALSFETGKFKEILSDAGNGQYIPTGHVIFHRQYAYYAARFDLDRLEVVAPIEMVSESMFMPAVSANGCLVEGPRVSEESRRFTNTLRPLVWVDRHGGTERLPIPPRKYAYVELSPNGKRLATSIYDVPAIDAWSSTADIWIHDLEHQTEFTFASGGFNFAPVWTPDGNRLLFGSKRGNANANLFLKMADGSGREEHLSPSNSPQFFGSFSPDERILVFCQARPGSRSDLFTLSLDDRAAGPQPLMESEFTESFPALSPDGHWLAYSSDETGRREIYVQPFPPTGASWRISMNGGQKPRWSPIWSPKGGELFYRNGRKLYAVAIETEPTFSPGKQQLLFEKPFVNLPTRLDYCVAPDGERFIFAELTKAEAAIESVDQLIVVQNWFEELE